MLSFRRRAIAALLTSIDAAHRPAAQAWVDGALADMPEHLKLGVAADSVLLSAWARVKHPAGATDAELLELLASWETSRLPPVRQYSRLLGSLVLFAEYELVPELEPAP